MYFKLYRDKFPFLQLYIVNYTLHFLMTHFLELMVLDKEEVNKPVGTATIPIPIKTIIVVNTFPQIVIGYISK